MVCLSVVAALVVTTFMVSRDQIMGVGAADLSLQRFDDALGAYTTWRIVGNATIDEDAECLVVGYLGQATVDLTTGASSVYGNLTFFTLEGVASTAANGKHGPRFGVCNAGEDALQMGIFRKSWLNQNQYNYIDTVTHKNYYSPYGPSSSAPRAAGVWRRWDFISSSSGLNVYMDGTLVVSSPAFSTGIAQIRFEGDPADPREAFRFDNVSFVQTGVAPSLDYDFPSPETVSELLADPSFFPVAVWSQPSYLASFYKNLSVNLFIANGLSGETDEQFLNNLDTFGIKGIITPGDDNTLDEAKVTSLMSHPALLGWMFTDEPDNMQWNGTNYVPGPTPSDVSSLREALMQADDSHSFYTNLGSGVSDRTNRWMAFYNYFDYAAATDIVSFDIYPVASYVNGSDLLWREAEGIMSLERFTNKKKWVFTWLECSYINDVNRAPTPVEVRAEAWMAIIHGADGIGWFPQVFTPSFKFKDIPADVQEEMASIGATLATLAPVLNSQEVPGVTVSLTPEAQGSVAFTTRWYQNYLYIFAVNLQSTPTVYKITLSQALSFEVVNEGRTLSKAKEFTEQFEGYEVHLYQATSEPQSSEATYGRLLYVSVLLFACFVALSL
ncbi:hypothetical protein Pelo_3611 [Pelomyxa schiedti]|nr:hypothetical protein Pelo_3611 [Pelomyxa schiedti]